MKRYLDKTILLTAAGLALVLLVWQTYVAVKLRGEIRGHIAAAQALRERVDANQLPARQRDEAKYSGRVFRSWRTIPEKMPPAQDFSANDIYPELPVRR